MPAGRGPAVDDERAVAALVDAALVDRVVDVDGNRVARVPGGAVVVAVDRRDAVEPLRRGVADDLAAVQHLHDQPAVLQLQTVARAGAVQRPRVRVVREQLVQHDRRGPGDAVVAAAAQVQLLVVAGAAGVGGVEDREAEEQEDLAGLAVDHGRRVAPRLPVDGRDDDPARLPAVAAVGAAAQHDVARAGVADLVPALGEREDRVRRRHREPLHVVALVLAALGCVPEDRLLELPRRGSGDGVSRWFRCGRRRRWHRRQGEGRDQHRRRRPPGPPSHAIS
jgi:hypothetical protein